MRDSVIGTEEVTRAGHYGQPGQDCLGPPTVLTEQPIQVTHFIYVSSCMGVRTNVPIPRGKPHVDRYGKPGLTGRERFTGRATSAAYAEIPSVK